MTKERWRRTRDTGHRIATDGKTLLYDTVGYRAWNHELVEPGGLAANSPAADGQIVTQTFIEQVLDNANTAKAMRTMSTLLAKDDVAALKAHIRQLPPLTREATLYRLLSSPLPLNNDHWRRYLAELSQQQPHFLLRHQQDGYWVTTPAFHYAAAARQQLNRYREQQLTKS
ncbi:hypothetical protein [Salinivibrio costicola]|uniref:hypothetical protein n=1 Tax=Salinivibrio costicola TaxID=51367 RepID=UPI0006855FAC|nr:hypothetical protein [Salinivibrio costicola]